MRKSWRDFSLRHDCEEKGGKKEEAAILLGGASKRSRDDASHRQVSHQHFNMNAG